MDHKTKTNKQAKARGARAIDGGIENNADSNIEETDNMYIAFCRYTAKYHHLSGRKNCADDVTKLSIIRMLSDNTNELSKNPVARM